MWKFLKQNRIKIIRGFAIFLAFFLILLTVLICLYDTKPDSGVKKAYWYNATYAVRAIMCVATLYTSFRIYNSSTEGRSGRRLAYAIHYSLFMLVSCCVLYFDPVTTVLLTASSLSQLAQNCQRMGIAYLIMVAVFVVVYIMSETAGKKKGGAPAPEDEDEDEKPPEQPV